MSPRTTTVVLAIACAAAAALTWLDRGPDRGASAPLVSSRAAARRVFPDLAEREVDRATIELLGRDGPPVRLTPDPHGRHQVVFGEELLGPVDPDALAGAFASLRMATTLRAVPPGTDVGAGQRGSVRITFPDATLSLALGHAAPAGNGLYGVMEHEGSDAWVVEGDLAWLVDQAPEAWLSRRLSLVEPEEVLAVAWGDRLGIRRGGDDLWRVQHGAEPAILSTEAVALRLERLFSARLDPLLPRSVPQAESLRAWLAITTADGRVDTLALGGACPGDPERRLLDRGPGRLACVAADVVEPWDVEANAAGLLEARLIPHPYGTVVEVALGGPPARALRRRGGGWVVREGEVERAAAESEVYRWFAERAGVELAADPDPPTPFLPDAAATFVVDGGLELQVRCQGGRWCARDDEPPRRVVGDQPVRLTFGADEFEDRRLLALGAEEVRAIELEPAPGRGGVRQSVHLDLGVWQLDAPVHPDGAGALDDVRLEELLSALSSLRAEEWVEAPGGDLARTLRVELTPRTGRASAVEVELHEGCTVRAGARLARVSEGACRALATDLLYDDPLRSWLRSARTVEVEREGVAVLLRREGERLVGDGLDGPLRAALAEWDGFRSARLAAGAPPDAARRAVRLTVRRDDGPTVIVHARPDAVHVEGTTWHYVGRAR